MRRLIATISTSLAFSLGVGGAGLVAAAFDPRLTIAAPAATARWIVNKAQSKLEFRSSFSGMSFDGSFSRWDATINFDPAHLDTAQIVVTVDLASAASGDNDRDQTLPTDDWFDVARFPTATFAVTSIASLGGDRYQAAGTLTMKGVTKPVALSFALQIQGDTAQMQGEAVIRRNEFGIGKGQFASADTVPFEVAVPITISARRAS